MSIFIAFLIGIIIGSVATYFIIQRIQQQQIVKDYEQHIQRLKDQHQQDIKHARNRSLNGSRAVIEGKVAEQGKTHFEVIHPDVTQHSTSKGKAYSVKDIRKNHSRAYMPWTASDDERLKRRYREGASISQLVQEFGRQPGGIRSRLKKLGVKK